MDLNKEQKNFIKFSSIFKDGKLRELKGAPLAVLVCRAIHSDENGYNFVSNETISKETGYSQITPVNRFLVKKGYLFMERVTDKEGRFRGWVSRLFLPVEQKFNGIKISSKSTQSPK